MKNIANELIKIAKELIASTKHLDEKDDLVKEFKKIIDDGGEAEFEYTKKDGSKSKRVLTPLQVFQMNGSWAVKGYETKDPRKIEKLFYLNMIGDNVGGPSETVKKTITQVEKKKKIFEYYKKQIIDLVNRVGEKSVGGTAIFKRLDKNSNWSKIYDAIEEGVDVKIDLGKLWVYFSSGKIPYYFDFKVDGIKDENKRWDNTNNPFHIYSYNGEAVEVPNGRGYNMFKDRD